MLLFQSSRPGLCASFRRDRRWRQTSAVLHGGNKGKSARSLSAAARRQGEDGIGSGFGGTSARSRGSSTWVLQNVRMSESSRACRYPMALGVAVAAYQGSP